MLEGDRSLPLQERTSGTSKVGNVQVLLPRGRYRLAMDTDEASWTITLVRAGR